MRQHQQLNEARYFDGLPLVHFNSPFLLLPIISKNAFIHWRHGLE